MNWTEINVKYLSSFDWILHSLLRRRRPRHVEVLAPFLYLRGSWWERNVNLGDFSIIYELGGFLSRYPCDASFTLKETFSLLTSNGSFLAWERQREKGEKLILSSARSRNRKPQNNMGIWWKTLKSIGFLSDLFLSDPQGTHRMSLHPYYRPKILFLIVPLFLKRPHGESR